MPLAHARMPALLAVSLASACALDEKQSQMLPAGSQILRVKGTQNRIFLDTGVKKLDQPEKRLVRTNRLVYQPYGINDIHTAIIPPGPPWLDPSSLWKIIELDHEKKYRTL